uniref:Uncharacterized protein n=1 Tax=Branchiostoma floridae TaxID=7739 RepID=C3XT06_BRAFL|eukprot:XP_002612730.1 hypothetical protein BRAFLDRAFT_97291 [Branchiostoma floridae]
MKSLRLRKTLKLFHDGTESTQQDMGTLPKKKYDLGKRCFQFKKQYDEEAAAIGKRWDPKRKDWVQQKPKVGYLARTVREAYPSLARAANDDKEFQAAKQVVWRALQEYEKNIADPNAVDEVPRKKQYRQPGGGRKQAVPEVRQAVFQCIQLLLLPSTSTEAYPKCIRKYPGITRKSTLRQGLDLGSSLRSCMMPSKTGTVLKARDGTVIEQVSDFKYLGSFSNTAYDVSHRIGLAWGASHSLRKSHTTNTELYNGLPRITRVIRDRRLALAGHVMRHDEMAGRVLLWRPDDKRRRGRPSLTLKRVIEEDVGLQDGDLLSAMRDRAAWRNFSVTGRMTELKLNLDRPRPLEACHTGNRL